MNRLYDLIRMVNLRLAHIYYSLMALVVGLVAAFYHHTMLEPQRIRKMRSLYTLVQLVMDDYPIDEQRSNNYHYPNYRLCDRSMVNYCNHYFLASWLVTGVVSNHPPMWLNPL